MDCGVRLDGNESPFTLTRDIAEEVEAALRKVEVNRYPDPEALELRTIIAGSSGLPTECILLGNGSDELIGMLVTALTGRSGKVLYPTPTFSMFRITALAMGKAVVEVPLDERFDIELDRTLEAIERDDPDLIFLASPNNPTGNMFSSAKIEEIINRSGGIVAVDEAYSDFSGFTFMPLLSECSNLVILRTLSKVGYAGLRLGILYASKQLAREINKVRYPYNINSLTQAAAGIVLKNHEAANENIQLIVRERRRMFAGLSRLECIEAYESDANFILFRTDDADSVFKRLTERDILIRNMNRPGRLENCLRVTIGTPEENDAFLAALSDITGS